MKRNLTPKIYRGLALAGMAGLAACGPPQIEVVEEIQTNETAFLVPLEGEQHKNQEKFMSVSFLEESKVAAKRVTIPRRKKKTGRFWFNYEWIPVTRVIKVDRSPVTREWTRSQDTGTAKRDQAIFVESKDSVGFRVGVNITASVREEDAAKFLYHYAGKPLSQVVDENVRGYLTSYLAREFGTRDLTLCKQEKAEIFTKALEECRAYFLTYGITINNLGHAEGLEYEDHEIQEAINRAYVAEMGIKTAEQEKMSADKRNEMMVAKAKAEREAAEEFQKAQEAMISKTELEIERTRADAFKAAAEKWNGSVPASVLPAGSGMLFGLDLPPEREPVKHTARRVSNDAPQKAQTE
ncbi:hypothetical protein HYR69_10135 [Candidatus Sumerlaeota bacterium]|nr:hypothetical protein [Candidatus Sumerlaeota bacterium]MBI3736660.1 hypothetical protein [Candidatus Sumerlaeota bacterium]